MVRGGRCRWSASGHSCWEESGLFGILGGLAGDGRVRRYQKFEGEYLFATRRIVRAVSDEVGKTAWVEEG